MNALNRKIEEGEKVVLKKKLFKPEYQALAERIVIVKSGFGMLPNTCGSAIYVKFVSDGEECRYEGYDIDVQETNKLQTKGE